jgi:hypothetical protein
VNESSASKSSGGTVTIGSGIGTATDFVEGSFVLSTVGVCLNWLGLIRSQHDFMKLAAGVIDPKGAFKQQSGGSHSMNMGQLHLFYAIYNILDSTKTLPESKRLSRN